MRHWIPLNAGTEFFAAIVTCIDGIKKVERVFNIQAALRKLFH